MRGVRAFSFGKLWVPGGVLLICISATSVRGQTDPGPRGGPAGAGGPIAGLSAGETALFNRGKASFLEIDSVSGSEPGAPGSGLGPRFNMNQCAGCHAQPDVGGSSPSSASQQNPAPNPQVAIATRYGAINTVPSFITADGPVREVRFVKKSSGKADGGVHDLYVITGRSDAGACRIGQEDFASAAASGNAIFRIPTPVFGGGLIAAIPDNSILTNKGLLLSRKSQRGISGHENRSANDGTITRFGWKAQNKSLTMFAGEAYNVEQGVTNEVFPNERDETQGCATNGIPEDHTNADATTPTDMLSDVSAFALFMQFLDQPALGPQNASTTHGASLFADVGCSLCHTPNLTTGASSSPALNFKTAALQSDLLVHHMGSGLADGITQGSAGPDEFRTAPLWGLGQRIFFLHDGRTSDLMQAIQAHASTGSEANATIDVFNGVAPAFSGHVLTSSDQQDLLNYLRSL